MFTLLAYHDLPPDAVEELRRGGVEIKRRANPSERRICADIGDCDALIAFEQPENGFNKTIIDAGKRLKLIARRGVGYETVDTDYAARNGIYVTNTPGINHVTVAEATVMLMLECSRNAQKVNERFRRERGDYPFFTSNPAGRGFELRGRTLGLIGCGRIGGVVARIAGDGFGMRVLGYDPYAENLPAPVERRRSREDIFREADFVSLHTPCTAETRGSVGMAEFEMMKPSAYLLNAARGDLVREAELIAALRDGVIRGAGLDCFAHEPLRPESYELFDLERVVLTPHNASFTVESLQRAIASVVKSVLQVAGGTPPECRVNEPEQPRMSRIRKPSPNSGHSDQERV